MTTGSLQNGMTVITRQKSYKFPRCLEEFQKTKSISSKTITQESTKGLIWPNDTVLLRVAAVVIVLTFVEHLLPVRYYT